MAGFHRVAGLLVVAACGGQSGENGYEPCAGATYAEVDRDDASLGFTAADVVAAMPLPVGVAWTELALLPSGVRVGGSESDIATPVEPDLLTFSGLAVGEPVQIVDLSEAPDCPWLVDGDRQLVFPLALEVSIGEGAVTSSGTVWLRAPSPEPARVAVGDTADGDGARAPWELPAALSGDYEVAFEAWWAAEQDAHPEAEDWLMEGVFVVPYGTLAALEVGLDAMYESSEVGSGSGLWRGGAVYED